MLLLRPFDMFLGAVIVIFVVSFMLSLVSLLGLMRRPEVGKVKKELSTNRVVFHDSSSSSSYC